LIFRVIPSEGRQLRGIVPQEMLRMEFGILFTSHSNVDTEPYPHIRRSSSPAPPNAPSASPAGWASG
jgi:hypothetical protein